MASPRIVIKLVAFLFASIVLYNIFLSGSNNEYAKTETGFPHRAERRPDLEIKLSPQTTPQQFKPKKKVVIYSATPFFNMAVTTTRFLSECNSTKNYCRLSQDPIDEPNADAILFHNADYRGQYKLSSPRKIHVLWSLESPDNDYFRPEAHMINWTMTYRKDSDIWYPYGHMVKLAERRKVDFDAIWKLKTANATATWLASNCMARNSRSNLIAALEKEGVSIDRWGGCGRPPPNCAGVDKQGYDCVVELIKPYKFYISFENTNCKDYATEKFYETLRSRMAVPIVIHRKNYEDLGAPGNAFIALDDFKSIRELADFVKALADNRAEYMKYHEWRATHEVIPEHHDSTGFCELCRRLQDPPKESKSYADVRGWHANGMCNSGSSMEFLKVYNPIPNIQFG